MTNFVPTNLNIHARTLAEVALTKPSTRGARPLKVSNPLVEVGLVTRVTAPAGTTDAGVWNGTVLPMVDWSATVGGSSGTGYTRVNVTLDITGTLPADPKVNLPFTLATLASCGSLGAHCIGIIPPTPGCVVAPCNATRKGYRRFNVSMDNTSFSVDLEIADAIILR